jgi:GT2 family glycosyltransferase
VQQALWFNRNGDRAQWICTFCTCNGSIRRSAFEAVGGLDESFAGHSYGYDYDMALRLHSAGFRFVYDPAAWLIHRRIPAGGLRMSDQKTRVNHVRTAQGLWTFVLRHGHRGMYRHLVLHHVLRKTVLLKRNLTRPWRQPAVAAGVLIGLLRARIGTRRPQRHAAPRAGTVL